MERNNGWFCWKIPVCPPSWPFDNTSSCDEFRLSRPVPGASVACILLHQSYCKEQTINSGAKLKVRGRVWKNRMTIIKYPCLALISLTSGLSEAARRWLMPRFAYSGHRHELHAPFTAPAIRFVEFLTPVESLGKQSRWSKGAGPKFFSSWTYWSTGLDPTENKMTNKRNGTLAYGEELNQRLQVGWAQPVINMIKSVRRFVTPKMKCSGTSLEMVKAPTL